METNIKVYTKSGTVFTFSFEGDFSLKEYLERNRVIVGDTTFLRVRKCEGLGEQPDETVVQSSEVKRIEVTHDILE